jgi:RNA polymerase subunit RPABC4/transcription elongation factor Spt4
MTGTQEKASSLLKKDEHCPDCGTSISKPHDAACDVARCLWTGSQRLACEAMHRVLNPGDSHDCGHDTWTGVWPGFVEAIEFGWWTYWDGPDHERGWDYRGQGWVRCRPDHPEAIPDLNRLITEARWDRAEGRWVQR